MFNNNHNNIIINPILDGLFDHFFTSYAIQTQLRFWDIYWVLRLVGSVGYDELVVCIILE